MIDPQKLKPGWKMVKLGDVVKNANLVERNPEANDIDKILGLEHIDPENLHIRRWNSPEIGTSFTRKFVPGQTLFGKRRAYQRKVAFAEFKGICSGDILTFEPKDAKIFLPELLPLITILNLKPWIRFKLSPLLDLTLAAEFRLLKRKRNSLSLCLTLLKSLIS